MEDLINVFATPCTACDTPAGEICPDAATFLHDGTIAAHPTRILALARIILQARGIEYLQASAAKAGDLLAQGRLTAHEYFGEAEVEAGIEAVSGVCQAGLEKLEDLEKKFGPAIRQTGKEAVKQYGPTATKAGEKLTSFAKDAVNKVVKWREK